jgi:hypothetical protein
MVDSIRPGHEMYCIREYTGTSLYLTAVACKLLPTVSLYLRNFDVQHAACFEM